MNRKRRWGSGLFGVILTMSLFALPSQANAATDSPLQMQAQVGWDGVFKANGWTTMTITLANSGAEFQGRVSVEATNGNQVVYGSFEKSVDVPAGKAQRVTLEVPSTMFLYPVNVDVRDQAGHEVLSQQKMTYQPVKQGMLIGGLVRDEEELDLFSLLSGTVDFSQIRVKPLTKADMPSKPEMLQALDLLELNSAEQSQLSTAQVQAIHDWVQNGGHLLLSGSAVAAEQDTFGDISPVRVTGTEVASDLTGLRTLTGDELNVSQLPVRTGQLQGDAISLANVGNVPLLAWRTVGRGSVLYAAYDLGKEPLASWQGNKELWDKLLTSAGMTTYGDLNSNSMNPPVSDDEYKRGLISSSGMFSKLAPSMELNLAIFTGYLLLIGPILFWLLRRAKKQALAWVLVPSTAIVAAVAIYSYGTASRSGGAFAQMHSQIRLVSEQHAEVDSAVTFLVENGGTYAVQASPGVRAFATKASYADSDWGNGDSVLQDGTAQKVQYRNVDYWSPRGAFLSGNVSDTGMMESDLRIDSQGHLSGTLTNKTAFDLDHVFVSLGNDLVSLPNIKKGQTLHVNSLLHDTVTHVSENNFNLTMEGKMFPADPNQQDPYSQYQAQRSLVGYAFTPFQYGSAPVQLFAFTEAPLNLFTYIGKYKMETTHLSLVRQDLTWHLDPAGAKLPMGMIPAKVVKKSGDVNVNMQDTDLGFLMANGQLTLDYHVQVQPGFVPAEVKTDLDQAAYSLFDKQLYNWKTQKWDAASSDNTPVLSGAALQSYVSPTGHLQIRLTASGLGNMSMLTVPHVGVAGKGAGR